MSLFAKAKKARENKKGFTLVELIVVLVILAILAAILVPALLGWIDKARDKQYVLDARNITMAAQALLDEAYAAGHANTPGSTAEGHWDDANDSTDNALGEISKIADVKVLTFVAFKDAAGTQPMIGNFDTDDKDTYTIQAANVEYVPHGKADSDAVRLTLRNGAWTVVKTFPTA